MALSVLRWCQQIYLTYSKGKSTDTRFVVNFGVSLDGMTNQSKIMLLLGTDFTFLCNRRYYHGTLLDISKMTTDSSRALE